MNIILLPVTAGTWVHNVDKSLFESNSYNQTSLLETLLLLTNTCLLGTESLIVKSLLCNMPCLKYTKYPVLALPFPFPSFLYNIPKGDTLRIAMAHTGVNLFMALTLLPFVHPIARLLGRF